MKRCTKCSLEKTADQFTKDRQKKDGLCSYCKDCYQAYYASVREHRLNKKKVYREKNAETISAYRTAHYTQNSEKERESAATWARENPTKRRASESNRRGRLRGAQGKFTSDDLTLIVTSQKWKCACCKKSIRRGYHADHIQPLSRGGSNDRFNIQALCPTCNMNKKAKDPYVFMQSKGYLL